MKKHFATYKEASSWIAGYEPDPLEKEVKLYQVKRYRQLFGTYTLVLL